MRRLLTVLPWVACVLLLALLLGLGTWQLDRATQKSRLLEAFEAARSSQPRPFDPTALASTTYQHVEARGRFLADRQYLLDNRTHAGRAGYHVLSVMVMADARHGLLVNRGWVPWGKYRGELPDISIDPTIHTVHGLLAPVPGSGILLGETGHDGLGWPRVVQTVEPERIGAALGLVVLPRVLLLDPDGPGGYVREWAPTTAIGPDRHRAYALQWFSLAATLVVIVAVVARRRRVGASSRGEST
ncbi:MAG: SURF1 family protein [Chromatiales bacterium]|nr:SURF1 family protein [Chromatiales bacterium]